MAAKKAVHAEGNSPKCCEVDRQADAHRGLSVRANYIMIRLQHAGSAKLCAHLLLTMSQDCAILDDNKEFGHNQEFSGHTIEGYERTSYCS